MRAAKYLFIAGFCANLALGQVSLPGTRRPEPSKPTEPPTATPSPAGAPPAQPNPTKPDPVNFPGTLQPITATTPLSDELLTIENAGLTMSLPAGSVLVQGANTDGTVYRVMAEDQSWAIEVQVRQTSNANATVHDTAELVARNVEQLAPTVRPGRGEIAPKIDSSVQLLQRLTQFSIAGCPGQGERLYFAVPTSGESRRVMGYTILKPMPTTFVIFELSCDEKSFDKARAAYEVSTATAKFEDPTKIIAARAAALTAGTEFLNQVSEEKLARLGDGTERWFRWYKPAAAGAEAAGGIDRDATEIGYRVVKVSKGRRSDIGAEGGGGRDNPAGLVVNTQVRLLQRGMAGAGKLSGLIDSDTKAFTSFDRRDEAWVTNTRARDLKDTASKPRDFSETGVRSGNSMSIVARAPGQADSVVQPTLRSAQYVSVGETPLLGSLLVLDAISHSGNATAAVDLGFYAYRADTGTVSLRRETVARDPQRANAWTVRSRQRDEKATTLSIYREDGTLVRTELPDGSVWEPIEPETLLKLWRSKNLPIK